MVQGSAGAGAGVCWSRCRGLLQQVFLHRHLQLLRPHRWVRTGVQSRWAGAVSRVGELFFSSFKFPDVPINMKETCAWFSFAFMGSLWGFSGKIKRNESTATPSVASGTPEATAGTTSVVSSGA